MNKKEIELKVNKEYEALVPRLDADDYNKLKQSIQEHGIRNKIHCLPDGTILCGHTRFKIAKELGIASVPYRVVKLEDKEGIIRYIIEDNLCRRQLNNAQKINLGFTLEGLEKEKAKQRQKELAGTRPNKEPDLKEIFPEGNKGQSRDKVAEKIGISGKTYEKGKKIKAKNPELWDECLEGGKSVNAAYEEIMAMEKEPIDEDDEIMDIIRTRLFKSRVITTEKIMSIVNKKKREEIVEDIVLVISHLQRAVDGVPVDAAHKAKRVTLIEECDKK